MKAQQIPAITPKTFQAIVSPWLTAVHKKDLLAIMSYPASDRQRRLGNLLDQPKIIKGLLPHSEKYLFISADYRVDQIHSPEQLEKFLITHIQQSVSVTAQPTSMDLKGLLVLLQKNYGKTIVLMLMGCERLLQEKNTDLLIWCTIQQRLGLLRQILFFETNLLSTPHIQFLGNVPAFQPRISTLTLYGKHDVEQFIRYKSEEWNLSLPRQTIEAMYTQCGGMLLLVKEALWFLRDHPMTKLDQVWSHTEMQFNLATLWHGFGEKEQQTLTALAHHLPITEFSFSQSLHYLLVTEIVKQKRNDFFITVPLLETYIRNSIPKTYTFTVDNGSILLNNTSIDANFSKNERATLIKLIQAHGKCVTRTTLANYIWPDNQGEYSDWALDSIVSRIRKKLIHLGVPPETIVAQKKLGIQLGQII